MPIPNMTINEAIDMTRLSYRRASWSIRLQCLLNLSLWVAGISFLYQSSLATDALAKANQNYDSNSPVKPNDLVSLVFSGLCDAYGDVYTLSTCDNIITQRQKKFILEWLGSLVVILGSFNLIQTWAFIKRNFNLELMQHYVLYLNCYFPATTGYDNVAFASNVRRLSASDVNETVIPVVNVVPELTELLSNEHLNDNVDEHLKKALNSLKTKWFDLLALTFVNDWVLSMFVLDIAAIVRFANVATSHVHTLFQDFCLSPYAGNTTYINNMSLEQWWSVCENHGNYNTTGVPEKIAGYCEGICDAVSSKDYADTNTLGVFLQYTCLTLSIPLCLLLFVHTILLCGIEKSGWPHKINRLICGRFFPDCYHGQSLSENRKKINDFIQNYQNFFFQRNVFNHEPTNTSNALGVQ